MQSTSKGKVLLSSVKDAAGLPGPQLVLKVGQSVATLRPVATRRALQNTGDVHCLTVWRNKYRTAFLTEFSATEPRTSDWLASVVGCDDTRILFMVDDAIGATVGYMGLAFIDWDQSYGEADAVVRGIDTSPGLMGAALQTLLAWARGQLALKRVGVRVRSDNPALAFYHKLGFVETRRVPLIATTDADGALMWQESATNRHSNVFLVHHVLGAPDVAKASTDISALPAQ